MNREIKFRGLTVDNLMVFGSLVFNNYLGYKYSIIDEDGAESGVDPNTIQQWTGLRDKDHASIYEGDILKLSYDWFDGNHVQKDVIGEVYWIQESACFGLRFANGEYSPFLSFCRNWDDERAEVIGNIRYDYELLKS